MKALMEEGKRESADEEVSEEKMRKVNSDLVFETAHAFLYEPEMNKQVVAMIQGAKDIGTAMGKAAAMVALRIEKELALADMPIEGDDIIGAEGGLTKILVILYKIANDAGMDLRMEDSLAQAYDVAEQDVIAGLEMEGSGGAPPMEQPPMGGPPPMGPPMGAPPAGGPPPLMAAGGGMPNGPVS